MSFGAEPNRRRRGVVPAALKAVRKKGSARHRFSIFDAGRVRISLEAKSPNYNTPQDFVLAALSVRGAAF